MSIYRRFLFCLLLGAGLPTLAAPAPNARTTARLATLSRVWGLLKYYHPRVAQGRLNWDSVLVATIPRVQAASSAAEYDRALLSLCDAAGPVLPGATPNPLPAPAWLTQARLLSPAVRQRLQAAWQAARTGENAYVTNKYKGQEVGQPLFIGEKEYGKMVLPSAEYRLLALFRFWNAIDYFYPYKNLISQDWARVQTTYLPRFAQATDTLAYHLCAQQLVAELHDTHGGAGSPVLSKWRAWGVMPFQVQQLGRQTVISQLLSDSLAAAYGVRVGDVITHVDGRPLADLRRELQPYVSASNAPVAEREINTWVLRGKRNVPVRLTLQRGGQPLSATVTRFRQPDLAPGRRYGNRAGRPAGWQLLDGNIGYLDLGRLSPAEADSAMRALHSARALVFDVRNYPAWPMPYRLIPHLYPADKPFIAFQQADMQYPGRWLPVTQDPERQPAQPRLYQGQVFVLANEFTQSFAEMTVMALQQFPGAVTVGSTTAGADGNVTSISLPGAIDLYFTGLGVRYPDGSPAQGCGINISVPVRPTAAGLTAGRDEVLEKALELARQPVKPTAAR